MQSSTINVYRTWVHWVQIANMWDYGENDALHVFTELTDAESQTSEAGQCEYVPQCCLAKHSTLNVLSLLPRVIEARSSTTTVVPKTPLSYLSVCEKFLLRTSKFVFIRSWSPRLHTRGAAKERRRRRARAEWVKGSASINDFDAAHADYFCWMLLLSNALLCTPVCVFVCKRVYYDPSTCVLIRICAMIRVYIRIPIDEAEALHSSFRLPHCALLVRDESRRRTWKTRIIHKRARTGRERLIS